MARPLYQALTRLAPSSSHLPVVRSPLPRLLSLRAQSSQPSSAADEHESSADPLLRRLEDAIHRIIVRRSAPDWLPFLPGSSYWVPPPRSNSTGLAHVLEKLANPLSPEESLSTTTLRGWPSSDYFIKGASPHPEKMETTSNSKSQTEDEEG